MDNKPLTNSQRAEAKAIQDDEDERIRKLEEKAPTTKTEMGRPPVVLPTIEDITKGVKKFGNKAKEFGGRVIDKIFQEPVKKAKGGLVTRADGAAKRGKTKGRTV